MVYAQTDEQGRFELLVAADQAGPLRVRAIRRLSDGSTMFAIVEDVRPGRTGLVLTMK